MKRFLIALMAGSVLAAAVYGAAASLGGINTGTLGADNADIISCDTDGVSLTIEQDGTPAGYRAAGFFLYGIDDDCLGKNVSVALFDGSGAQIAQELGAVVEPYLGADNNSAWKEFAEPKPLIEDVEDTAVRIAG